MQSKAATEGATNAPASASRQGLAVVQIAVLFFGLSGVLGRMSALAAPLITFGRVVVAGVALLAALALRRLSLRPHSRRDLAVLVLQGVLLAGHWTAFFAAINASSVAVGVLAFSTFPLFTAAIEALVLKQRLSGVQLAAALLTLPGIYLLVPALSLRNPTTLGVALGLLAGASFAVLSVVNRWLGRAYPSLVISAYQDVTAALVLAPALYFYSLAPLTAPRVLLILLVLGLFCTALAHTLFVQGLRFVSAQLASLIANFEPVWAILFAFLLLGEVPSPRILLGGAIILGALLLPLTPAVWSRVLHPSEASQHARK